MQFHGVTQIIRNDTPSPGIDWGRVAVLVRLGDKEMWKMAGQSYSANGFKTSVPGRVVLVGNADAYWRTYSGSSNILLGESSRVSSRLLTEWKSIIDKFFGCEVTQYIDPKLTTIIEAGPAKSARPRKGTAHPPPPPKGSAAAPPPPPPRSRLEDDWHALRKACRAAHAAHMKGGAGGAALCVCGAGGGGCPACSMLGTLRNIVRYVELDGPQSPETKALILKLRESL